LSKFKLRNDAITTHLAKTHYPVIILAGSYVPYFGHEVKLEDGTHHSNEQIFKSGFMKALEIAYQSSDQVILLNDVPRLDQEEVPADCNLRNEILNTQAQCTVSKKNYEASLLKFNRMVAEAKLKYP